MDRILRAGRSGGAASLRPAHDLAEVGHRKSPSPAAGNPLECPTGSALPSLRTALRHKLKTEPAEHRPFIRNVITTLDIMLGNRPADEREAARKQTLRNIDHLERARAAQSGYVA